MEYLVLIIHAIIICGDGDQENFTFFNMPMQNSLIFLCCKTVNFRMKKSDFFLSFALNIDCGYTQSTF